MPNNLLLSKARVLIVDDEPSNVRLLERILEMSGAPEIRSTTDSRQALTLMLEYEPDIVLLDLHMPHLDGFAVMALMAEALPSDEYLPILVLTADITPETKRKALGAGAKDFVTKPIDHSEVTLRILNLLENRFLHLELRKQNSQLEEQVRERTSQLEGTMNELRSTQEAVVKQERLRALGMMAGGIAHDFNNALTMMLGYGELLLPWIQEHGDERENSHIHHMIAAAQDATQIVSRLKEFYRPAEDNEIRDAVDVNAVVDQAVSLTSPRWKGRSRAEGMEITVITQLGEAPTIAANAAELREVLTNLIFNSVDAMPDGGAIIVTTSTNSEGRACIAISDTGIGMTQEELQRCLEPFFTTKGDRGTGLGLSVVYGIVQRHDGRIEIESHKGSGTTFTISFPASDLTESEAPAAAEAMDRNLHILVVDDQEIICELIAEHLKCDGHIATFATDPRKALDMFRTTPIDLVITDQSMPGMNGLQFANAIKQHAPGTPVILLTGFGEEMMARGLPENVDLVLGKPVSVADLRNALHDAMARREPHHA